MPEFTQAATPFEISGGGGGAGGASVGNNAPSSGGVAVGNAGKGGDASFTMNEGSYGAGGGGAFVGDSGTGDAGGNASSSANGSGGVGVGSGAGDGTAGGSTKGGNGGNGGSATVNETSVSYMNGLSIFGGNGGGGAPFDYSTGGAGGDAMLEVTNDLTVTGNIALTSGLVGQSSNTTNNGAGGAAQLTVAGTLTANGSIEAKKQGGNLNLTINTLDVGSVTTAGTILTLTGTATADVNITTVALGNNKIFTVNGTGAATFTNLNVNGVGTLAGSVAPAFSVVNLEAGSALTSTANDLSFNTLNVKGASTLTGNLNAVGKTLNFTLPPGIAANATVLTVAGTATINDASIGTIGYTNGLSTNDKVNLINASTLNSTVTNLQKVTGQGTFLLNTNGNLLEAMLLAPTTFLQATNNRFNPLGQNNINLQSGATVLDTLAATPGFDPTLMTKLGNAFNLAYALPGDADAAVALQQLEGGSAMYAVTPLATTHRRFRYLWQGQARSKIDRSVFAARLPGSFTDAGVASSDAFASPHYGVRDTVPAGSSRIWAGGFGAWADQDNAENLPGYKYDSQGAAIGYEYSFNNCLSLGFAAAYSRGDLKVNDLRYENKPDIMNLALYGVYTHPSGFYAQGGLGYGHAWNDYTIDMLAYPGTQKKGKYGSDDWSADLELGYVARLPQDFNLIPSVGLEYDYLRNGGWTESIHGNPAAPANQFYGDHDSSLGIPLGLRFNKLFAFGCNGGYVVPEVRAQWVYMADKSRPFVNAGYAGAPGSVTMYGVNPGSNFWRLGTGLSGRFNERVDFRVDYDFDTRSGFRGHNLMGTIGVSF